MRPKEVEGFAQLSRFGSPQFYSIFPNFGLPVHLGIEAIDSLRLTIVEWHRSDQNWLVILESWLLTIPEGGNGIPIRFNFSYFGVSIVYTIPRDEESWFAILRDSNHGKFSPCLYWLG